MPRTLSIKVRCGAGTARVKECWSCRHFISVGYVYPASYYDEKGIMQSGYYIRCGYKKNEYRILVADAKGRNKMVDGYQDLQRFVVANCRCLVDCPRAAAEGWGEQYDQLSLWGEGGNEGN